MLLHNDPLLTFNRSRVFVADRPLRRKRERGRSSFMKAPEAEYSGQRLIARGNDPLMSRFATVLVLLVASVGVGTADVDARLVGQQVRGIRRSCVYENGGSDRTRVPFHETNVGAGEPCPFQYRSEPRRQPRAPSIPAMATLSGSALVDGRMVCRYTYLGIDYARTIAPSLQCPMTPHFLP